MKIKPIIGIEVHLELKTASKMFCGCSADHFGKKPNTLCCPVCLGLPGSLPVPNKKAIEWTILLGLALDCQVANESYFERKNYFYPDLPKGYQISQYHKPLAINGKLKLIAPNSRRRGGSPEAAQLTTIKIQRVHLEEDTGKLLHTEIKGKKYTLIDFNRAGVPLVEIVSEPDINSAQEAKTYLQKVQQIIRYLGISDAQMEKGTMRCEPNVNVKILDKGKWIETPIVEIKNINSFKFVQKAIDYEIKRQIEEYQRTKVTKGVGNKSTRGFNQNKGITYPQRQKEEAFDYRYFPEPDIPLIRWTKSRLSAIGYQLSAIELPDQKLERFIKQYRLTEYQAMILTASRETADYFEETISRLQSYKPDRWQGKATKRPSLIKRAANWIINKQIDIGKILPKELAKKVIREMEKETLPIQKVKEVIRQIIGENKKAVRDYKLGKQGAVEFLLGQVIRVTKGEVDPVQARKILLESIKK